jgi:hypothetical protein
MHTLHELDVRLWSAVYLEDPAQGVGIGGSKGGFKIKLWNDLCHSISLARFQLLHKLEDLPTGAPAPSCPFLRVMPHSILSSKLRNIQLVISDVHTLYDDKIFRYWPEALHGRCILVFLNHRHNSA